MMQCFLMQVPLSVSRGDKDAFESGTQKMSQHYKGINIIGLFRLPHAEALLQTIIKASFAKHVQYLPQNETIISTTPDFHSSNMYSQTKSKTILTMGERLMYMVSNLQKSSVY